MRRRLCHPRAAVRPPSSFFHCLQQRTRSAKEVSFGLQPQARRAQSGTVASPERPPARLHPADRPRRRSQSLALLAGLPFSTRHSAVAPPPPARCRTRETCRRCHRANNATTLISRLGRQQRVCPRPDLHSSSELPRQRRPDTVVHRDRCAVCQGPPAPPAAVVSKGVISSLAGKRRLGLSVILMRRTSERSRPRGGTRTPVRPLCATTRRSG